MTQPRRIVAGQFYMVTRRTAQRTFLLRPDDAITGVFEYCLAEAASRYEIELIAWVAMSNHYHAIVFDRKAQLPAFLEHFHKMPSKCLNVYHSRCENLWSSGETCVTHLVTLDDVFDKAVYVLTNPASAHLVEDVGHWPGSTSWTRMGRQPKQTKRPAFYFRKDGVMPPTAPLSWTAPRGLEGETADEWIGRVRKAVRLKQDALRQKRIAKGVKLVGRKGVCATNPFDSPSTDTPRRRLKPALACKDVERMKEARIILKGFRAGYRSALEKLRTQLKTWFGKRTARTLKLAPDVEFPAGTYRLRILFSVRCEPHLAAAHSACM